MAPAKMKTRSDVICKESFKAKHPPPMAVSKRKADGSPLKPNTTTQVKRHLVDNTMKENNILTKAKSHIISLSTGTKKTFGLQNTNTHCTNNANKDAKGTSNVIVIKKSMVMKSNLKENSNCTNITKLTESKLSLNEITTNTTASKTLIKIKEGKVQVSKVSEVKPLAARDINTGLAKPFENKSKSKVDTNAEAKDRAVPKPETKRASISQIPVNISKFKTKAKAEVSIRTTGPVTRQSLNRKSSDNESTLYESALEDILNDTAGSKPATQPKLAVQTTLKVLRKLPPGVEDFDSACQDLYSVGKYAFHIFEYLKTRESDYKVTNYMAKHKGITKGMRALLVDWLVEIQENFELFHETLYLAVKIIDLYLSKVNITKDQLQLLGCTAMLIACKYDERITPVIYDFIDVSDRQFTAKDVILMECKILKAINYDLGCPLSYRFLRRYSRCAKFGMPMLTLARYILELSLMDFPMALESESKLAAAALYIAIRMKKESTWTPTLEYYSGYKVEDFKDLVMSLNNMLRQKPKEKLSTVRKKYSSEVFHKVALIPLLDEVDFPPHTS